MKIQTRFQGEGINKRTITLEDQKKLILEGKEVEEINHEGTELEKTVTNKGTNALIVKEFMEECIKDSNGVLPGKTIFFCLSINHARRIEQIFDSLYPQYKGELAKVLVSEDSRVHGKGGLLDQFKNNDLPRIAISVDMLDTGIDVREILNLVFAKPVYSYTKFWQMIGRGTRLLEESKLKSWCTKKDTFLILDCWDNFEYFKLTPKGKELKLQIPLPVKLFGVRLDKIEKAIELNEIEILEKEKNKLQDQINLLPENSVVILDAKSEIEKVKEPNFWNNLTGDKIEFIRNVIKPLLRTVSNVDFKAMRFERDVLEASLAYMANENEKYETLKEGIIEIIAQLPLSVNIIAREADIIKKAQTNYYWANAIDSDFDNLINRLSPIMKFIEIGTTPLPPIKYNFQDFTSKKEFVEFGPQHASVSIEKYREMVEEKIKHLSELYPLLKKVHLNITLTDIEVQELTEYLHEQEPYITENLLRKVYDNKKAKFIEFIKHILGLELLSSFTETVSNAFSEFISNHTDLTTRQLQFMDILKSYILEKGDLQKRDLISPPFTKLHPDGIRGIFTPHEIDEILILTQKLVA